MPHPKAAPSIVTPRQGIAPLPPQELPETSFAPPPREEAGAEEDYDEPLPPPPPGSARGPSSARGKKKGPGKKADDVAPTVPHEEEEELAPINEAETLYEDVGGEEMYYEEGDLPPEETEALDGDVTGDAGDKASVASDDGNSEPPDVQVEVAQLQDMVNKCLKTALKGCPCTILHNGERTSSRYYVDEALENVSVVSWQSATHIEVVVPIMGIQDIFCVPEDGEQAFPPQVISTLSPEEKSLILMIVYQGRQGEYGKFCLLMESKEGRDGFMEAMRVLCVASRFNAEQGAGGSAKSPTLPGKPGHKAADGSAMPRQQVSVRFFMRSIGVKALQNTVPEQSPSCPLPCLIKDGTNAFLSAYGYKPKDDVTWDAHTIDPSQKLSLTQRPTISIRVRQHFEAAKHTWYIVETSLRMDKTGNVPRLDWLAPRRLAHLRCHLHDQIRAILGESYNKHFAGHSFAHRLGLPGTTAQLHRWAQALADLINARRVPPIVVATTLNFLEAPNPATGAGVTGVAEDLLPFQGLRR